MSLSQKFNRTPVINHLFPEERAFLHCKSADVFDSERKCYKYHYTDLDALKSILKGKNIWLVHFRHLNDASEGDLVFEKMKKKISGSVFDTLVERYENIVRNFYLCSFSLFGNRLSQWRNYGSSMNIGFDFNALNSQIHILEDRDGKRHVTSGIDFARCEYLDDSVGDIDKKADEILRTFCNDCHLFSDKKHYQFLCLKLGVQLFGNKHIAFFEENEYRLFYFLWNTKPFIHKKSSGKEIKHLKYHFQPKAIKRVVVGPSPYQDNNYKAIARYINSLGEEYKHIQIFRSKIPYKVTA